MSRTKIPNALIHNPKEVEQNAIHFDNMCRVFQSIFQPRIKVSVNKSDNNFKNEFEDAIRTEIAFIVSLFYSVLHESHMRSQFNLTKYLLPSRPELQKMFIEYLELNHGIPKADVFTMMEDVQKKLFENVSQVLLPSWKLRITKDLERFHLETI